MASITKGTILNAIRIGIVIVGGAVTALTVYHLASMPPPPPESDGFAHGMAALFGGGIILASLGLATISIIVPTLVGVEDPLDFSRRQRLGLKGAGGLIGLGIAVALVSGLQGVVLLLGLLALAFGIVCLILVWRFAEAIVERRSTADRAS